MLAPGLVVLHDFRQPRDPRLQQLQQQQQQPTGLRLVQWNIERGYQYKRILDTLRRLDADIVALQEIDIHCKRSDGIDVGKRTNEPIK